jgi:hypothetical protein
MLVSEFDAKTTELPVYRSFHKDLDKRMRKLSLKIANNLTIEVTVKFSKGGMNYYNYEVEPKGYYASVTYGISDKAYQSFTYAMGDGAKIFYRIC